MSTNFGIIGDYNAEIKRITSIMKSLRQKKSGVVTKWKDAAEWHMKYSNLYGKPSLALTVTLSPTGCEWATQGGCTMCGEFEGSLKRDDLLSDPKFHISQFVAAVSNRKVWETVRNEGVPLSWIRINQEGSYTNKKEMNIEAQELILRLAMRIDGVKRITIESRPQFLNEKTVGFLSDIFKDSGVELEIGMGVEAENDIVRNVCINKQGNNSQFVETVKLLKKYNIHPLAYILLKPPFLGEQEAIDEAVSTAHFVADIGYERISLEPVSIHQYTLIDLLKETGDYKAPWLWSVVEVARRCEDISNIFGIGGVGYYPIPSQYAQNYCLYDDCNKAVIDAIMRYNTCRDVTVFDSLQCKCIEQWKKECHKVEEPLKERINHQLDDAENALDLYKPPLLNSDAPVRSQRIITGGSQKNTENDIAE